jgi:hypothetical protein
MDYGKFLYELHKNHGLRQVFVRIAQEGS